MKDLHIIQNKGNSIYDIPKLDRNSKFLLFFYRLRPIADLEDRANISIAASKDFRGEDECEIEGSGKKISFLLTEDLTKDLQYFRQKYLRTLEPQPIAEQAYHLEKIALLDHEESLYEISIALEKLRAFKNPRQYWKSVIEKIAIEDSVKLFTHLNSFYRQLITNPSPQPDSALTYLQVVQERIASSGISHLTYDNDPLMPSLFPVKAQFFEVRDETLEGKVVTPYMYLQELDRAVFFDPGVYWSLINSKEFRGKLQFDVESDTMLDLDIT